MVSRLPIQKKNATLTSCHTLRAEVNTVQLQHTSREQMVNDAWKTLWNNSTTFTLL